MSNLQSTELSECDNALITKICEYVENRDDGVEILTQEGLRSIGLFKQCRLSNNETLTLYIEKTDTSRLGIRIENGEKNTVTNFKLNLLESILSV